MQIMCKLSALSFELMDLLAYCSIIDLFSKFDRSLSLPLPKQETLSRHSFFGPNGLRGQWFGPSAEVKVSRLTFLILFILDLKLVHFILLNLICAQLPLV